MPKTFPCFQFRFLQKHETSGAKEDHRLDIKRSNGCYLWIYRDPDLDHTETITLKNREEVFERLEILADLLGIDEDPLLSFQVFVPGMPTVLAKIKHFQAYLGILQRALDATIERWPIRASWAEVEERLDADNCHDEDSVYSEDEDEEGEDEGLEEGEVDDDESTDSDMPPLESYTPQQGTDPCCPCGPPATKRAEWVQHVQKVANELGLSSVDAMKVASGKYLWREGEDISHVREVHLTRDGARVHLRFE
jgi:hypothetical protein